MAGLDPAIQSHTLGHGCTLHSMAASEGGHGVVDEADYPQTHLSRSVMAAKAAIHDRDRRSLC